MCNNRGGNEDGAAGRELDSTLEREQNQQSAPVRIESAKGRKSANTGGHVTGIGVSDGRSTWSAIERASGKYTVLEIVDEGWHVDPEDVKILCEQPVDHWVASPSRTCELHWSTLATNSNDMRLQLCQPATRLKSGSPRRMASALSTRDVWRRFPGT